MKNIALLFLAVLSNSVFAAKYEICNGTGENVDLAFAHTYLVQDDVFGTFHTVYNEARGWFPVKRNGCKTFEFNTRDQIVLFYARGSETGTGFFGDDIKKTERYCTNMKKAFHHKGSAEMRENGKGECPSSNKDIWGIPYVRVNPGRFVFEPRK